MFAMSVRGEDEVRGSALEVLNAQRMLHVHGNETQRDGWIHRLGALPTGPSEAASERSLDFASYSQCVSNSTRVQL